MRRIRPLTGQVLIEVLPVEKLSPGGIALPERTLSPEEVEASHRNPEKPKKPAIGIVREIGPWPKTRTGMLQMPEFARGAKVAFNPWRGTDLQEKPGERLKLVHNRDVMAVFTSV